MNTLVALPIAGALPLAMAIPDAAAAPTAVVSADPIFALMEAYRTAAKAVAAAASEVDRREDMLIEQGLGTHPFISVLNVSGLGGPQPTMVYKHEYIDQLLPTDRFSKPNAEAHASLDAQIERHKAIVGDSERVLNAAQDAETEAVDELIWTTPTTISGVVALLELFPELRRARVVDDDQADAIKVSVIHALDNIHPNARLASVGTDLMKIEHRRHALTLASQLPDGRDDALAVLDCVRELIATFV